MPRSYCGPAMGPGLLHCVAFCLLGAGHMGAMVIQSPRYQVTKVGKPVTLNCSQNLNHDTMYWYQQKLRQAPKLLLYYYDTELTKETDTSDNFQPSRLSNSLCSLSIRSPGLGDSAVYLCASSKDTEVQCYVSPVHKPLHFPDPRSFSRPSPSSDVTTVVETQQ
uniref:Ig-like domain-containing protein n=1 Tax=Canis lupus familiaris TaxID=9615 RepID=A0A8C0Q7B6_CANLF